MATKTYGTVSPEQQKAMSALEFVKGLASGMLPLNTIAQTLGYDVVEAESGRIVITMLALGIAVESSLPATFLYQRKHRVDRRCCDLDEPAHFLDGGDECIDL